MRPKASDVLITLGALAVLVTALVALDKRVRDHIAVWLSGASLTDTGTRLTDLGSVMLTALRDQSIEHAPLAVFVTAAVVLVVFMLRT